MAHDDWYTPVEEALDDGDGEGAAAHLAARRALQPQAGDTLDVPRLRFEDLRPHLAYARETRGVKRARPAVWWGWIPLGVAAAAAAATAVALVVTSPPAALVADGYKGDLACCGAVRLRVGEHVATGVAPLTSRTVAAEAALAPQVDLERAGWVSLFDLHLRTQVITELAAPAFLTAGVHDLAPVSGESLVGAGKHLVFVVATDSRDPLGRADVVGLLRATAADGPAEVRGRPCSLDMLELERR